MSLKKTKSILLKDKEDTVGVIKLASAITSVKPTLGLAKTGKYKESIKKVLNEAKIKRTQERINTFFKKKK